MGVIKRQGFKSTMVSYVGVIIGAIAALRVYPLDMEIYGYAQWLISTATLMLPLATVGFLSLLIKYFPAHKKADGQRYSGFLTYVLSRLIFFYGLFLVLWYFFKSAFIRFLTWIRIPNAEIIEENEFYLLALLGLMILMRFFINQSWNGLRIVVPNILEKLGFKLFLPVLVLVYIYKNLSTTVFTYGLLVFFLFVSILMAFYLKQLGILKFGKIKRIEGGPQRSEMTKFALYSSLNNLGITLATRLDSIMIPLFLTMSSNGFYNIALFVSNVLDFPSRSLTQIAAPILSQAWEENDFDEINKIYKQAATNLFLLGGVTFLVIWFVLDDLAVLSADPESFGKVRAIFLILALAKMIDMLTSVNSHILIYSPSYRLHLVFLLFLGGTNVLLNLKLIPIHGLAGAAIATTISMLLYNLLKTGFLYFKYGFQPFSVAQLKVLVLIAGFIGVYQVMPETNYAIFNLVYKSAFVGILYLAIAYFWKVSEDANEMGINILKRLKLIK